MIDATASSNRAQISLSFLIPTHFPSGNFFGDLYSYSNSFCGYGWSEGSMCGWWWTERVVQLELRKPKINIFLHFKFWPQNFTSKVHHIGLQLRWPISAVWAIHLSPCLLLILAKFLSLPFFFLGFSFVDSILPCAANLQEKVPVLPREVCRFAESITDTLLISIMIPPEAI